MATTATKATAVIDVRMYPGVVDRVLYFSSAATLEQFAVTSKTMRKRVFDHFLPLRRLQFAGGMMRTAIFGISKNGDGACHGMYVEPKHVLAHSSAIKLVDVMGFWTTSNAVLARLLPSLRLVRFLPHKRSDVWVTTHCSVVNGRTVRAYTVTYPWSFQAPSAYEGSALQVDTKDRISGLVSGMFHFLPNSPASQSVDPAAAHFMPKVEPRTADTHAAILMLEHPKFTYVKAGHDAFHEALVHGVAGWFLHPPHSKLVFVNMEPWLKLRYPNKNAKDLLSEWRNDIFRILCLARVPLQQAVAAVTGMSFMSLEQYEAEIGAAHYKLCTEYEEFDVKDVHRLQDNE